MTKEEFLENLSVSLSGKVRTAIVMENVSYYEDYINTEVRKGKTEEEVLETLGDPRLIAKTIVETSPRTPEAERNQDGSFFQNGARGGQEYGQRGEVRSRGSLRVPLWLWAILAVVVAVLVVSAVFSILSAILPVLIPILLVVFLVKLFRDSFN